MNENDQRQMIVNEAKTWLLTPWHHEGRIKGAGVDCGMFLIEIFERTGLIPHIDVPHYPRDFMLHRDEEWYLNIVLQYCNETELPLLPGDIILMKNGRLFSHGLIVIDYPLVIHASAPDKMVIYGDVIKLPLSDNPMRYFRLKRWCA